MSDPIEITVPARFVSPEDADAWIWKNEIEPRLIDSGLESRYRRDIREWGNARQLWAYSVAHEACRGVGAIVALVGVRGAGKTTIAAQMIVDRVKRWAEPPYDPPSPYRKCAELVGKFKSFFADYGSTDTEVILASIKALCRHRFMVIDELHECDDQKMKGRVITDILDRRYAARKDTVLISNQTPDEFQKTTSDSILSRLHEHGAIVPCQWKSWRENP